MRVLPVSAVALVIALVLPTGRPAGTARASRGGWFTDHAAAAGIDFVHFNGMQGHFDFAEIFAPGVALLDFDNDGDLDVYFPQGSPLSATEESGLPESRPALLTDRLYRNDLVVRPDGSRTLRFTDVSAGSGLDVLGYGMTTPGMVCAHHR